MYNFQTFLILVGLTIIGIIFTIITPKEFEIKTHKLSDFKINFKQLSVYGRYWWIPLIINIIAIISLLTRFKSETKLFLPLIGLNLSTRQRPALFKFFAQLMVSLSLIGLLYATMTPYLQYQIILPQFSLIDTTEYIDCVGQNQAWVFHDHGTSLFYTGIADWETWPIIKSVKSLETCVKLSVVAHPDGFYQLVNSYTTGLLTSKHRLIWQVLQLCSIILVSGLHIAILWQPKKDAVIEPIKEHLSNVDVEKGASVQEAIVTDNQVINPVT